MNRKAQRERYAIIGVEAAMIWPYGDVPDDADHDHDRAESLRRWRGQDEAASGDDCEPVK